MKSALIKLLIALFTFLIGIGAFFFWSDLLLSEPQGEITNLSMPEPKPTQISACQLLDEPENFDGKLVSFEAVVYVIYDGTVVLYPNCNRQTDNFIFAKLELGSYTGTFSNLKTLLEGRNRTSRDDFKEVDIRVVGTAKITYDSKGYKWYSVSPSNIEVISTFRKFEPKGAA